MTPPPEKLGWVCAVRRPVKERSDARLLRDQSDVTIAA
jgi:hypothetical protein